MPGFDRCFSGPQCLPGNLLPEMIGGASFAADLLCLWGVYLWHSCFELVRAWYPQVAGTKCATKNNELGAHVASKLKLPLPLSYK